MRSLKLAPVRALTPFVAYLRVTHAPERAALPYLRLPDGAADCPVLLTRLMARVPASRPPRCGLR